MSKITKKMLIEKIDTYLQGKLTKREISQWAIQSLQKECFSTEEMLIEDTLTTLSLFHDEDERFDTAKEDLIFYRDCLLGKKSYGVKIEFLPSLAKTR